MNIFTPYPADISRLNAVQLKQLEKLERFDTMVNSDVKYPASVLRRIDSKTLHITEYRDEKAGKMLLVPALGTICFCNPRCIERMFSTDKTVSGVCANCYAGLAQNYRAELLQLSHNYLLLNETILNHSTLDDVAKRLVKAATTGKTIDGTYYPPSFQVRIEHKGDVGSAIHAANYLAIAAYIKHINPAVSITAWTKNPDYYDTAIKLCGGKNYLRIGYSAFETGAAGIAEIERMKSMYTWLDFGFMVYSGGKPGTTNDADSYNRDYVNTHFDSEYKVFPCRCKFGSCMNCKNRIGGSCYTCRYFTIFCENLRTK